MKVITLRLPEGLHAKLKAQADADGRSFNSFAVRKLQGDTSVISQEGEKIAIGVYLPKSEVCHECDEEADYETETDWETGEVRFYCDPCVRKGKSPKQYKMFKSNLKKL